VGSEGVMPVRAAALCQPESGALQPEVGSACGEVIIEKASSKDQRGHNPQTPRGETPQGGKQHTGEPTRQQLRLFRSRLHSLGLSPLLLPAAPRGFRDNPHSSTDDDMLTPTGYPPPT